MFKKFIYQSFSFELRENGLGSNSLKEEKIHNDLGEKGWDIYQIDKKPLYDEKDMSKGNCYSIVYCKKEKTDIKRYYQLEEKQKMYHSIYGL